MSTHLDRPSETRPTPAPQARLDEAYMRRALELAELGAGHVAPNPMVGAVIVKDGRVIGEGWHERFGEAHAERNALAHCTEDPRGATAYVTLEPCCHHGHQPPCTDALIEAGVARVVAGARDVNPLVAGHGLELLHKAGIEVEEGVLAEESERLNAAFFKHMRTGLPLVTLKYAMTLDGKTAVRPDAPARISGERSWWRVQEQRGRVGAVMVGSGTVLADDPLLTCRIGRRNPLRVVVDGRLRAPLGSALVTSVSEGPVVVATIPDQDAADPEAHAERARALRAAGVEVLEVAGAGHGRNGEPGRGTGAGAARAQVGLSELLRRLADEHGVDSVVVEGGSTLAWSLVSAGLADRVEAYVAPTLLGGSGAPTPLGGAGFPSPDAAPRLEHVEVERLGQDLLVAGDVVYPKGARPCSRD